LSNAFSHWTYEVTGGLIMILDISGWKIDAGKYVMSDLICFSSENTLG